MQDDRCVVIKVMIHESPLRRCKGSLVAILLSYYIIPLPHI